MKWINERIRRFFPYIVIIGLWLIFCFPYFVKGLAPFPSKYLVTFFPPWSASYGMALKNNAMPDIISQIYPWKTLTIDTWKKGEIPLWNPYSFSGTVHAGNYQSAVFSPLNALFFFLPFIDAWSLLILLQPLLAGLFTFFFLRQLRLGNTSSTLGAIGFMFCGFLVTWMAYGTLGFAVLFLPLILYSISRYQETRSLIIYGIGICGITFSFLSGHFQISLYVWLTSLGYILFETIRTKKWKVGLVLLFMPIIGLCFASPQIFLTFDAFQASVRSAGVYIKEVIPWNYGVTLFAPDFYGNPVTRNDWFGHYAEWAGYIGIVPLILCLYGIVFSKEKQKVFFMLVGFITLLFAYTSPLSVALFTFKIPVLSTSAASRIIVISSFSFCVLASFGFEKMLDNWKRKKIRNTFYFISVIAFCILFLWTIVYVLKPFTVEQMLIAKRNIILPSVISIGVCSMIVFGFINKTYSTVIASVLLIALGCFDSYRYASKWMPFEPKEFVYPEMKVLSYLKKEIGDYRVFGNIGNEAGSTFQIPLIEGYDAMYQGRYGEFINAISNGIVSRPGPSVVQFDKGGRYALPAFQLLGVKYILHRLSDGKNVWVFPHWLYPDLFISRYRDEHYEVFEYKDVLPPVFLVSSYAIKTDKQDSIDTLFKNDFDRKNSIVVEEALPEELQVGEGSIQILSSTPNKLHLRVINSSPHAVYRSQVFDPGWNVLVDNKKAKLYRANYDFQAVFVPKGTHDVLFYYWPQSLTIGLYVCGLGCGFFVGIIWIHKKK